MMSGWKHKQECFDWTEERLAKLRELWDSGMATEAIGAKLGTTKNSVVGKAHRLKLPSRPSPIKSDPNAPRKPRKKAPRAVQLTLPSEAPKWRPMPRSPFVQPDAPPDVSYREAMDPVALRAHAETRRAYKLPVPVGALGRSPTCQWTDSERRPWVFCGCKSAPGYSYCEAHRAVVFRPMEHRDSVPLDRSGAIQAPTLAYLVSKDRENAGEFVRRAKARSMSENHRATGGNYARHEDKLMGWR